jgi:N-acetylneuraminic acid mutarotase
VGDGAGITGVAFGLVDCAGRKVLMYRWLVAIAAAATGCGDDGGAVDGGAGVVDARVGPDSGRDGWFPLADVGGGPIQEIGVAALDGKLYVVGGFDAGVQLTDAVQVYDPDGNSWSLAAPLPEPVHHSNVAVVGGKLYVVGAMVLEGFNFVPIADVWEYDPTADEWIDRAPMPAGTERGASAVGVIDGRIYVAGGLRGGAVSDVSSFDPAANEWDTSLPPLPRASDHLAGGAVGGTFYAVGGRNGGITSLQADVSAYTPGGAWESRAPMPTARGGCAAAVVGSRIVVIGGEGNAAQASGVFSEVEAYDTAADQWEALEPMRTPRHGMGAATIDGLVYVPGGATTQGFGAVDTHEAIAP